MLQPGETIMAKAIETSVQKKPIQQIAMEEGSALHTTCATSLIRLLKVKQARTQRKVQRDDSDPARTDDEFSQFSPGEWTQSVLLASWSCGRSR